MPRSQAPKMTATPVSMVNVERREVPTQETTTPSRRRPCATPAHLTDGVVGANADEAVRGRTHPILYGRGYRYGSTAPHENAFTGR